MFLLNNPILLEREGKVNDFLSPALSFSVNKSLYDLAGDSFKKRRSMPWRSRDSRKLMARPVR